MCVHVCVCVCVSSVLGYLVCAFQLSFSMFVSSTQLFYPCTHHLYGITERRGHWSNDMWCIKYLRGFTWKHLTESLRFVAPLPLFSHISYIPL